MLEALTKDALINIQGLLPSSLAEQPSSSQAQGSGMTAPKVTDGTGGSSEDGTLEPSGLLAGSWAAPV